MKTYNYLFGLLAFLLMAAGCGKDEPDMKIEPPVFNLQQSSAVEAVDLGLSVLWSNCNMGASSPRDDGGYFAWGDPTGALWSANGIGYNDNGYTWNTDNYGGNAPMGSLAGTTLDIATVHWGSGWHVPTYDEFSELCKKCQWTLLEQGGKKWIEVKGPNGNSIDLPLAGMYIDDTDNKNARFLSGPIYTNTSGAACGFYWTSSVCWKQNGQIRGYTVNPGVVTSWALLFTYSTDDGKIYKGFRDHVRAFHMSIRPVHDK